jgi:hypothetical protein
MARFAWGGVEGRGVFGGLSPTPLSPMRCQDVNAILAILDGIREIVGRGGGGAKTGVSQVGSMPRRSLGRILWLPLWQE